MFKTRIAVIIFLLTLSQQIFGQTDQTTPLHLLKPDYPMPYGIPKSVEVTAVLDRIRGYLDSATPVGFINEKTNQPVSDYTKINADTILARGDFRIVSYEWGVTYAGMLLASEATGDPRFRD